MKASWHPFYDRFKFTPAHLGKHPGIVEPEGSVTFDIGHVYGHKRTYDRLTLEACYAFADAFRLTVSPEDHLHVLEWQGPCYAFHPHRAFVFHTEEDWPIPPVPNGDYHIFLARDLRFGVFGHPWRQTMCVWGDELVAAFETDPPALFSNPIRKNGLPIHNAER